MFYTYYCNNTKGCAFSFVDFEQGGDQEQFCTCCSNVGEQCHCKSKSCMVSFASLEGKQCPICKKGIIRKKSK